LFPNNYEVLRGYGMVEYRRNNMKDAIGYLQRANKIYENDIETLILLAKAHTATGDFASAQKYSVRAIELDATNTDAQIIYARILTQFQGLETGVLYLRDLITKFSYTMDFRMALADLYREQERSNQAQKIYEQIIDVDPRNKKAHLGLGESYQAQGFFDRALKEYLTASVLDPFDAEGLFRAGLLYMEISKYSDAITQLKRAQAINPLFPRLNYYMGRAYFQNNQYDAALMAATEERKINPNIADSYILAAEVYAATKQFQKCSAEYQQAIKLRPQGAELYVKVARCYRQSGSPDIAESMLNIAANQESGLPEIYKEQGAVYETKGDMRAAVQAYNKYLALSPNAPDKREIEGRILSLGK
jgi:tetratricopeptide (TPR) repeat protein